MNQISYAAKQLAGQPLLIDPRFLQQITLGGEVPLSRAGPAARRSGTTKVIQVLGPLAPRGSLLLRLFGGTDLESLSQEFGAAMADSSVSDIALLVDSPGGSVTGVSEFADQVYAARGKKPVTAYVEGMAASAAYWIASAASRIVAADTARMGSIGVVAVAVDDRGWQTNVGIRFHEIVSSNAPAKRPDPLTKEGRAIIQREVDALAAVFVAKVARNRGVSEDTVLSRFGQGAVLVGSDAVAAGLADAVGTFGAAGPAAESSHVGANMEQIDLQASDDPRAIEARCSDEWLQNEALRAEFSSLETFTAYTKAAKRGAARIMGRGRPVPSVTDSALDRAGDDVDLFCAEEWDRNSAIREEFSSRENFIAYAKARRAGRVRITGAKIIRA